MAVLKRWRNAGPMVVGLIDDNVSDLQRTEAAFEGAGVKTVSSHIKTGVSAVLDAADSALVVDWRLEQMKDDSLRIARDYARLKPGRPIVFISNLFIDETLDRIATRLSPLTSITRVRKADLEAEKVTEWIGEQLAAELAREAREELPRPESVARNLTERAQAALAMTPARWQQLELEEQDELASEVSDGLHDYLAAALQHSDADWIVVAGPEANIVRWGVGVHPTEQTLEEVQALEGLVPFFFARPLEVDQIDLGGSGPMEWHGTKANPNYPGIAVKFGVTGADRVTYPFLFDTGSDNNYLSSTIAREAGLAISRIPRSDLRSGEVVRWREIDSAAVSLSDGRGQAHGETSWRAVTNWGSTLGRGKEQQGIVSIRALVDLKTAVRLCGRTRTIELDDPDGR